MRDIFDVEFREVWLHVVDGEVASLGRYSAWSVVDPLLEDEKVTQNGSFREKPIGSAVRSQLLRRPEETAG